MRASHFAILFMAVMLALCSAFEAEEAVREYECAIASDFGRALQKAAQAAAKALSDEGGKSSEMGRRAAYEALQSSMYASLGILDDPQACSLIRAHTGIAFGEGDSLVLASYDGFPLPGLCPGGAELTACAGTGYRTDHYRIAYT